MADEDSPEASFDVRLDWPEDELRDASASQGEPSTPVQRPTTSGDSDLDVRVNIGGVLGLVARQVQIAMSASEQGIADLRSLVSQNEARLRRIGARVEQVPTDVATAAGVRQLADEVLGAVASQARPSGSTLDAVDIRATLVPLLDAIADVREVSESGTAAVQAHTLTVADVAESVRSLHDLVADLPAGEAPAPAPAADSALGEEIATAVRTLQTTVVQALDELREDMVQLKRRIAVRTSAARGLEDEDIDKIVVAVVRQLEEAFEPVPDEPRPPAKSTAKSTPKSTAKSPPSKRTTKSSGSSSRSS
jgi:hypothetical protein